MIDSDDDGVDDDDDDDDDDPDEDDAAPSTIDLDEDEVMNDERTVTELRQVEGKHKMSFQQIKEELLGSVSIYIYMCAVMSECIPFLVSSYHSQIHVCRYQ